MTFRKKIGLPTSDIESTSLRFKIHFILKEKERFSWSPRDHVEQGYEF